MKVTYIGQSDVRIIGKNDLPDAGLEEDLVWLTGQTIEVPDDVGEQITENMRNEFKNRSDTTRDLRSVDELLAVAQELKIKGRSKMDREQLLVAVTDAEIAAEEAVASGEAGEGDQGLEPDVPEEP